MFSYYQFKVYRLSLMSRIITTSIILLYKNKRISRRSRELHLYNFNYINRDADVDSIRVLLCDDFHAHTHVSIIHYIFYKINITAL